MDQYTAFTEDFWSRNTPMIVRLQYQQSRSTLYSAATFQLLKVADIERDFSVILPYFDLPVSSVPVEQGWSCSLLPFPSLLSIVASASTTSRVKA